VSASLPAAARSILAEADAVLRGWGHHSLAPERGPGRALLPVCELVAMPGDDALVLTELARGLAEVALAEVLSFPDNLCCDFEFMAANLLRRARATWDPIGLLRGCLGQIARLQRLYGQDTAIRFRYVHDFVYGYDWAKWVGRDPDLRAGVGPFDAAFLDHLESRAHELLGLIAVDDPVYPGLPDEQARNPFPFSREPDCELRLHRALAARGLIPIAAWDPDALPVWSRPFAALRVELAIELGLASADGCAARG
jgi:hypothetical protein